MTSNLGSDFLFSESDFNLAKEKALHVVRKHFRPEFLNRLDDIVVFSPLERSDLINVVRLQLQHLTRLLNERRIVLRVDESAIEAILSAAYDPAYGARPLRRYIDKQIGTHLSKLIIKGDLTDSSVVEITATDGKLAYAISPLEGADE